MRAITNRTRWAQALEVLAPHLPAALLAEALTSASAITTGEMRAWALRALAPKLQLPCWHRH